MDKSNDLLFRRQFVMGSKEIKNIHGWQEHIIGEKFYLYCHPELSFSFMKEQDKEIYVLGYILDPYNPKFTNDQIIEEVFKNNEEFSQVLNYTEKYSGRWILMWKDKFGMKMMNDACGTRQIYFYRHENGICCGSQPSIIAHELGLTEDEAPEIKEFINSKEYIKNECAWIGDGTIYKNLWHLLPNHYLDLDSFEVKRFWPNIELNETGILETIKEAAAIVQGTINSALYRFGEIMLSVTAGADSRMNLAACKPIKDKVKYIFCMDGYNKRNVDYKISSRIFSKLNLKQDIIGLYKPDEEFNKIYNQNVTQASNLPPKRFIYSFYKELPNFIHVSGVGAGIAKSFYCNHTRSASVKELSKASKYKNFKYVEESISRWLGDAKSFEDLNSINLYDVFYWEHRMGNWGAKSCAEQDIAIEETWTYNNRKLMKIMLAVNEELRKPPFYKFQRSVIEYLWKETLCEPVNPNLAKKALNLMKNILYKMRNRKTSKDSFYGKQKERLFVEN